MNPFVISRIIKIDYVLPYEPDSNTPTKEWADYIPPEVYNLWDEDATAWLRDSFFAEKTQELLQMHNDLEKRLKTEPVGSERSRLVNELSRIKSIASV